MAAYSRHSTKALPNYKPKKNSYSYQPYLLVYRYKCTHERRNVVALSNKDRSLLQSTPLSLEKKKAKTQKKNTASQPQKLKRDWRSCKVILFFFISFVLLHSLVSFLGVGVRPSLELVNGRQGGADGWMVVRGVVVWLLVGAGG